MADPLAGLRTALLDWSEAAAGAGWLDASVPQRLRAASTATPGALYADAARPLVVGLFGGTGVGKSALLNRVAGREIARSSAERPTSTGVSAYVHASVGIERLPPDFPMARLHTVLHDEGRWRDVLFLDMPDFDSVAVGHRAIVERWLPYIDVVLYAVSPERYRDDRGWRLLVEHGRGHAWLFVMNHWDRGDPVQLDDFRALLVRAGFEAPEIFRTICRPPPVPAAVPVSTSVPGDRPASLAGDAAPEAASASPAGTPADDFAALVRRLETLADGQLVADLQARGVLERVRGLLDVADGAAAGLSAPAAVAALPAAWRARWAEIRAGIAGAARAPANRTGAVTRAGIGTGAEAGTDAAPAAAVAGSPGERYVDETLRARLEEAPLRFAHERDELPHAVAMRHLEPVRRGLARLAIERADAAVGTALAAPGTPLQRAAHRGCRALSVALPVAAVGWAGWRAVAAFAAGGSNPAAYLGADFAINAGLLLAFAWAVPWGLARRLAPSLDAAVDRGLRTGLDEALDETGERVAGALDDAADERAALDARLRAARGRFGASEGDADGVRPLPDALRRLVAGARPATAAEARPAPQSDGTGTAGSSSEPSSGPDAGPASAGVRASAQSSTDATPVS